ncbi:meiotic nuclear division protein 1 [Conidiobolus coronatus NRRL 28638]|uniref:Meiotic nuclear division protein 1 n=1 Tax=Conidiobolus coronatus (strain ATCC 28846 / CBS 209.66 / NRRL 28638) TaxID=796925 RepID=A0A137P912_CONC2|nr:meiotic nuclear division protein 1 [Conidiobolus coronatus NRRL 28638]|eukprot:KXN71434.1 meiotic nuclear division protein 1 [Conidiobolus coronatus NRRL 28638]
MSKKGVSQAEKLLRLEQLFHEKKDFYQLKEVENMAFKEKKIVLSSVKDVLMELIGDSKVNQEKIGTSNYYWSFPSEALQKRENRINEYNKQLETIHNRTAELEKLIETAKAGRVDSDQRSEKLKKLAELEEKSQELTANIQQYIDNDPEVMEAKEAAAQEAKLAANRWIENIWALMTYCKKFGFEKKQFNESFDLPEDLDTFP